LYLSLAIAEADGYCFQSRVSQYSVFIAMFVTITTIQDNRYIVKLVDRAFDFALRIGPESIFHF